MSKPRLTYDYWHKIQELVRGKSKCRCISITEKVIDMLEEFDTESLHYMTPTDFHTCCAICCDCSFDRFAEDVEMEE
jgi:hypothetical protein